MEFAPKSLEPNKVVCFFVGPVYFFNWVGNWSQSTQGENCFLPKSITVRIQPQCYYTFPVTGTTRMLEVSRFRSRIVQQNMCICFRFTTRPRHLLLPWLRLLVVLHPGLGRVQVGYNTDTIPPAPGTKTTSTSEGRNCSGENLYTNFIYSK